jgi:hypothetical protein
MQAINRIQNAIIDANAVIQGALVVDSANAHRAYPSFTPCDTTTVSKCPGKRSRSSMCPTRMRSQERLGLALKERGRLTYGPAGGMWRHDSHHNQMPATIWATLVLNRQLCG